jgi:hypothetical protein
VIAQFTEDFESGTLSGWTQSNTERWAASASSPIQGNFSLQHIFDNPDAGNDQISIDLPFLDMTSQKVTWRFRVRHSYDPSSSNHWGIFICSDTDAQQMFPGGVVNGYVVGVNLTSYDDTLRLWKITNGTVSEVVTTTINWQMDIGISLAPAMEINRSREGDWEFRINAEGNFNNTYTIGTGNDAQHLSANYLGVYYKYSSAQDMKLRVDDIYFGDEIQDTIPPRVSSLEITDSTHLRVHFTERVDSSAATTNNNYLVSNGIENPDSITIDQGNQTVNLFFDNPLVNKTYYHLDIIGITDLEGNMIVDTTVQFLYFKIEPHHVVINEIMADPNPPVSNLPEEEYIELFNTTPFEINLANWKIISGSSQRDIPSYILEGNQYVTLCSEAAASELSNYGAVIPFASFTNLIANSGTTIKIKNDEDIIIDSVNFTPDWYQDPAKEEGGWSLEKIDPLNICSGITNWKASEHLNGGTPGFENSVFGPNQDTLPPFVDKPEWVTSQQIRLYFNEPLEYGEANNTANYSADQGIGHPYASLLLENRMVVDLLFLNPFPEETTFNLTIKNLADWCNNVMPTTTFPFTYYVEKPFDIVINEIMADPEPVVGLPGYEYLELYNTTGYDLGISGWTIAAGSTVREIPAATINAGEYLVLCSGEATAELENYCKTIAVSGFPSLTNSGQTLVLRNRREEIISSVTFSDQWYQNEYKAEGGWSLEQIDPYNPCGEQDNWKASVNLRGGTPGQINSIDAENPDTESPELLRAAVPDKNTVQLFFSESLHPETAKSNLNYWIDHGLGHPDTVELIAPGNTSVWLSFDRNFEYHTLYEIEIQGDITDCSGNIINGQNTARFAIPQTPETFDLVINEILFNPFAGGVDFVEIYNRSDKVFDLNRWYIASFDDETNNYQGVTRAADEGHLIFPGEYLVITKNPEIVMEQYYTQNPGGFAKAASLPSFNNDRGHAIIMDNLENRIDQLTYTEDMHFALLASNKGVSLERISYDRPADDQTNWHSASEVVGFATPAYQNSQFNPQVDREEKISIAPEVFSPDNDGYQDVTNITFTIEEPGTVATIKIFDSRGRLLRILANNLLLGINQTITWDGLDDKNQKAPMGIYVVFIELFDLEGNVKQYKKSVVVASKL